jgi:transketolase
MGERFINAGVAEQNMVAMAAGIASEGLDVWVYSIAPFLYARPFEQIRNDLCLHRLPVKLVGNGGGYAYGAMGATHHALEDYGVLLTLGGMRAFVPAFADDLAPIVARMSSLDGPSYLRLGRCEKPEHAELPAYAPWRRLRSGEGSVVITVGPLAGSLLGALAERPDLDVDLWALSELPLLPDSIPAEFLASLERSRRLCVIEEHVATGSAGAAIASFVLGRGIALDAFEQATARGYPSGLYGSQHFHRRESGLDSESLVERIEKLARRS